MKILLLGEYSGVYTELRKGFEKLGHEVFSIAEEDGPKKLKANYIFKISYSRNIFARILKFVFYRLGINGIVLFLKQWKRLKELIVGYDLVLFINPIVFAEVGSLPNYLLARYVIRHNKKIILSVLGDDYYVSKYYAEKKLQNGFYNPKWKDYLYPSWEFKYRFCLGYKKLNQYIAKEAVAIVPGIPLYAEAYSHYNIKNAIIPFPINDSKIGVPFTINKGDTIRIFHGWQRGKEKRKGNDIIDRVVKKLLCRYEGSIEYNVVSGVPYDEYVKLFKSCHIFIDQLYAQDKGMNGLLGMAAGKVVLSGFKDEALKDYQGYVGYDKMPIGIRAVSDENCLYEILCEFIEHPKRMELISKNAIEFVCRFHSSSSVAVRYLNLCD